MKHATQFRVSSLQSIAFSWRPETSFAQYILPAFFYVVSNCYIRRRCDTHRMLLPDSRGNSVSLCFRSSSGKMKILVTGQEVCEIIVHLPVLPIFPQFHSLNESSFPGTSLFLLPKRLLTLLPEDVQCYRLLPTSTGKRFLPLDEEVYWRDFTDDQNSWHGDWRHPKSTSTSTTQISSQCICVLGNLPRLLLDTRTYWTATVKSLFLPDLGPQRFAMSRPISFSSLACPLFLWYVLKISSRSQLSCRDTLPLVLSAPPHLRPILEWQFIPYLDKTTRPPSYWGLMSSHYSVVECSRHSDEFHLYLKTVRTSYAYPTYLLGHIQNMSVRTGPSTEPWAIPAVTAILRLLSSCDPYSNVLSLGYASFIRSRYLSKRQSFVANNRTILLKVITITTYSIYKYLTCILWSHICTML